MHARCCGILAFFCLFLFLTFLRLVEESLELLLLSQDLQQLEDHWHIVVASAFVLRAPVGLPLALCLNLTVLHGHALVQLNQVCCQRLVALARQPGDLPSAHLILPQVSVATVSNVCWQLPSLLLTDPVLQGGQPGLLFLELSHLVTNDGKQVKSDLTARVLLNPRLDLLSGQAEPGIGGALTVHDRAGLETV